DIEHYGAEQGHAQCIESAIIAQKYRSRPLLDAVRVYLKLCEKPPPITMNCYAARLGPCLKCKLCGGGIADRNRSCDFKIVNLFNPSSITCAQGYFEADQIGSPLSK